LALSLPRWSRSRVERAARSRTASVMPSVFIAAVDNGERAAARCTTVLVCSGSK
jgi:hypothetical protein